MPKKKKPKFIVNRKATIPVSQMKPEEMLYPEFDVEEFHGSPLALAIHRLLMGFPKRSAKYANL